MPHQQEIPDIPLEVPLEDTPNHKTSVSSNDPASIIGFIQVLIQEGVVFHRVLLHYNKSFSIRTRYPKTFWLIVVVSIIFDGLYFLLLSLGILSIIFLIIYTFAKGVGFVR
jgi:hypothetical protein